MDASEQLTLDIVSKVSTGQMPRSQGQKILGVSERTLRRYLREFARRGALFIKHGNYNKKAANRSDAELKKEILALVREKYFDFNVTHCWEKLHKEHAFSSQCRHTPALVSRGQAGQTSQATLVAGEKASRPHGPGGHAASDGRESPLLV